LVAGARFAFYFFYPLFFFHTLNCSLIYYLLFSLTRGLLISSEWIEILCIFNRQDEKSVLGSNIIKKVFKKLPLVLGYESLVLVIRASWNFEVSPRWLSFYHLWGRNRFGLIGFREEFSIDWNISVFREGRDPKPNKWE
jgi:hypothetical protein